MNACRIRTTPLNPHLLIILSLDFLSLFTDNKVVVSGSDTKIKTTYGKNRSYVNNSSVGNYASSGGAGDSYGGGGGGGGGVVGPQRGSNYNTISQPYHPYRR